MNSAKIRLGPQRPAQLATVANTPDGPESRCRASSQMNSAKKYGLGTLYQLQRVD